MRDRTGHIDLYLFIPALALMAFSVCVVYSASSTFAVEKFGDPNYLFHSHAERVILGIIALFVGMKINYHLYKKISKLALIISIGLLLVLLVTGGNGVLKGAHRWLGIGSFSFQPSDFARFALVFHLAVLIAEKQKYITDFIRGYLPIFLWSVIVGGLVLLQPNLSTAALIFAISLMMLFVGHARISHLVTTMIMALSLMVVYTISAKYRLTRVLTYLGIIQSSNQGGGDPHYQVHQAIIGLGNGGLWGVGLGQSKQRDFFLPESYGDFIYAIIGEEYGFIGAVAILAAFCLIMIRGMKIAKHAPDDLGKYMAIGITCSVCLYALVNAAVSCGLLPTTGLAMPLVSYGGTSFVFTAFAVGVLLNISTYIRPGRKFTPEPVQESQVGRVYK